MARFYYPYPRPKEKDELLLYVLYGLMTTFVLFIFMWIGGGI